MITAGLYDLFVLFLVCLFAWRGYKKGLVGQLGALLVLVVVAFISVRYTPTLADFLGNGNASNATAFVITIIIVTLIAWYIVNALSKLVTKFKLKTWNNQMGAFLGLLNGIFISMLMTFLLLVFVIPHPTVNEDGTYNQVTYDADKSFIKNSFFGPYLTSATLTAIDHLPQGGNSQFYTNLRNLLQSKAENIKEQHPDLQQTDNSTLPNGYNDINQTPPQGQPRYPNQNYPNQNYPNQNYPNQNYPNQNYPNQNYPNQNYPNQNYPNQNYPDQGYPNQSYPHQNYPNQGYPNQNYPDQGYPNQSYPHQNYPNSGYNGGSYPSQAPQRQPNSNPHYNGASPLNGVL